MFGLTGYLELWGKVNQRLALNWASDEIIYFFSN